MMGEIRTYFRFININKTTLQLYKEMIACPDCLSNVGLTYGLYTQPFEHVFWAIHNAGIEQDKIRLVTQVKD